MSEDTYYTNMMPLSSSGIDTDADTGIGISRALTTTEALNFSFSQSLLHIAYCIVLHSEKALSVYTWKSSDQVSIHIGKYNVFAMDSHSFNQSQAKMAYTISILKECLAKILLSSIL